MNTNADNEALTARLREAYADLRRQGLLDPPSIPPIIPQDLAWQRRAAVLLGLCALLVVLCVAVLLAVLVAAVQP